MMTLPTAHFDYDAACRDFNLDIPDNFNFAFDFHFDFNFNFSFNLNFNFYLTVT